ncbi:MAG: PEGA domain-containing protein [Methanomicrobiales archaeon]|jgi:hypothetical protein|nr:PEGA domain-containing protein [Methanomicrobiales archaeon]
MKKASTLRIIPVLILCLLIQAAVSPTSAEMQRGTIAISSNPQGATIFLNDEDLGLQTNTVIQNVFPGIHFVRLELPGYRTWEQIFEVREGGTAHIVHTMEPIVGDAFSITTKPTGAQIFIDGDFYGISNTVLHDLPVGQHHVLLMLNNYSEYSATVIINEGMSESIAHTFETIPDTGRITVASVPSDAGIYLNGEYQGTTQKTLDDVVPGRYNIVITKTGYDNWTGTVDVAAGKISEINADLRPAKVILSVTTIPRGVDVVIDGIFSGTTPLEIPIEQGLHTLRLEKFGYQSREEMRDVGADGASLFVTLVSMAPQAIAEAEQAISDNLDYNPEKAREALDNAKKSYAAGDSENAITYAASAIALAWDADGDGVKNPLDFSPNIHNSVIYVSPFLVLFLFIGLIAKDMIQHRVKPEITVRLPVSIREGDLLKRAEVTADALGGPYRGFVCTVYIDSTSVDHFTEPGTYDVMLSGKSPGVHTLMVHLQVAKERYGNVEKKVAENFTVEPAESASPALDVSGGSFIPEEDSSQDE